MHPTMEETLSIKSDACLIIMSILSPNHHQKRVLQGKLVQFLTENFFISQTDCYRDTKEVLDNVITLRKGTIPKKETLFPKSSVISDYCRLFVYLFGCDYNKELIPLINCNIKQYVLQLHTDCIKTGFSNLDDAITRYNLENWKQIFDLFQAKQTIFSIDGHQNGNSRIEWRPENGLDRESIECSHIGKCFIFANEFKGSVEVTERKVDGDISCLVDTFYDFGYHIEVFKNAPREAMYSVLKEFANHVNRQKERIFVCCLLTHGQDNDLLDSDCQPFRLLELKECLAPVDDLPVIFFIQACRGEATAGLKNCMTFWASSEGSKAYRRESGQPSPFVENLTRCLKDAERSEDLMVVCDRVSRAVKDQMEAAELWQQPEIHANMRILINDMKK